MHDRTEFFNLEYPSYETHFWVNEEFTEIDFLLTKQ